MSLTPRDKVAQCSKDIWSILELLRNQQVKDGDLVAISKGALQLCCDQIDEHLSDLLQAVAQHSESDE